MCRYRKARITPSVRHNRRTIIVIIIITIIQQQFFSRHAGTEPPVFFYCRAHAQIFPVNRQAVFAVIALETIIRQVDGRAQNSVGYILDEHAVSALRGVSNNKTICSAQKRGTSAAVGCKT